VLSAASQMRHLGAEMPMPRPSHQATGYEARAILGVRAYQRFHWLASRSGAPAGSHGRRAPAVGCTYGLGRAGLRSGAPAMNTTALFICQD